MQNKQKSALVLVALLIVVLTFSTYYIFFNNDKNIKAIDEISLIEKEIANFPDLGGLKTLASTITDSVINNAQKIILESAKLNNKAYSKNYKIRRGESLWSIAKMVYGSGKYWIFLFENNSKNIKNPDLIYAGNILKIKDLRQEIKGVNIIDNSNTINQISKVMSNKVYDGHDKMDELTRVSFDMIDSKYIAKCYMLIYKAYYVSDRQKVNALNFLLMAEKYDSNLSAHKNLRV